MESAASIGDKKDANSNSNRKGSNKNVVFKPQAFQPRLPPKYLNDMKELRKASEKYEKLL